MARATRLRIKQAIADLGYHPNAIAQRLAGDVRVPSVSSIRCTRAGITGYELRFISAAANAVNQAGYAFVLLTQPDRTGGTLDPFFFSGLLDGVILFQVRRHDLRIQALKGAGLPFVLIGQTADNTGLAYVDIDIIAAMTSSSPISPNSATTISHACTRMTPSSASVRVCSLGTGWRARLHGIAPVVHPCALSTEGGQQATVALLQSIPRRQA